MEKTTVTYYDPGIAPAASDETKQFLLNSIKELTEKAIKIGVEGEVNYKHRLMGLLTAVLYPYRVDIHTFDDKVDFMMAVCNTAYDLDREKK